MQIERRTDGSEIFHNVNGDWVDIGGNIPDDANDLELVEQPPDGHPFATAADLAAAPQPRTTNEGAERHVDS